MLVVVRGYMEADRCGDESEVRLHNLPNGPAGKATPSPQAPGLSFSELREGDAQCRGVRCSKGQSDREGSSVMSL
jgi:hypothetical protein